MVYPVIAIDGPSASGKGTVAAKVAETLGWAYLDSGALYRLTALYMTQQGVSPEKEDTVADLATHLPVMFHHGDIFLNGNNVAGKIRSEEISLLASQIAALPKVRAALLQRQRDFAKSQGLVADGRDMATVVFPNAVLKIFLTATAQIRAERRAKQLGVALDTSEFQQILSDIEQRDEKDKNRAIAPLKQAEDAYLIDSSHLTIDETVVKVLDLYRQVEK
ncbi:MAG: (d)CMP kinase [Neisseriaceae bacterium]|nr:(d)CMP kinase [Neisseriaceae bacterium]